MLITTLQAGAQPDVPDIEFTPATNENGSASGSFTAEEIGGKWNITITCNYTPWGGYGTFKVKVETHKDEVIRFITVDGYTTGASTRLHVRGTNQYQACGPVEYIQADMPNEVKLVELWMEGDLGTAPYTGQDVIEGFDQIGGVDIVGDVYGDIVTTGVSQNSIYVIKGDLHGNLIALDGYHRDIKILSIGGSGGNLYGDIIAENGWIKSLIVDESIGSPGAPVNIWSRASLDYLECQDLYANIDTTLYGLSAAIYELRVESADPARGNFEGSINCGYFENADDPNDGNDPARFVITGEQRGEITIARDQLESVDFGTIMADTLFSIGYTLLSKSTMNINGSSTDPKGLKGQIIINSTNGSFSWDGTVKVDGTVLSPVPYYDNKSVDLGGGAVGLVPFSTHRVSCSPVHGR